MVMTNTKQEVEQGLEQESLVRQLSDDDFKSQVLDSERPVLVDFWAAWCGPCRLLAPEIEELARRYEGQVDVAKLDIEAYPLISEEFGIMSIPTVKLFVPGQEPQTVVGYQKADYLAEQFELDRYVKA